MLAKINHVYSIQHSVWTNIASAFGFPSDPTNIPVSAPSVSPTWRNAHRPHLSALNWLSLSLIPYSHGIHYSSGRTVQSHVSPPLKLVIVRSFYPDTLSQLSRRTAWPLQYGGIG